MRLVREERETFDATAEDLTQLSELRGISVETLELAQIHVTSDGWWGIPYLNVTGNWYVRKRNPDPDAKQYKYLSPKNAEPHLYNPLGLGPNADEVWFCEGEFDTLALIDAGIPAIGYPGVSTITEFSQDEEQEEGGQRFKGLWALLYSDAFVVAAGDMDTDGKRAIRSVLRAFAPRSGHFQVDSDYDDINDWWQRNADGMLGAIEEFRADVLA